MFYYSFIKRVWKQVWSCCWVSVSKIVITFPLNGEDKKEDKEQKEEEEEEKVEEEDLYLSHSGRIWMEILFIILVSSGGPDVLHHDVVSSPLKNSTRNLSWTFLPSFNFNLKMNK